MISARPPGADAPRLNMPGRLSRPQHKGQLLPLPSIKEDHVVGGLDLRLAAETLLSENQARPLKIALVGSYAPRQCGIATFTADVETALRALPGVSVDIWPVRNAQEVAAGEATQAMVEGDDASFRAAARTIEQSGADIVILQHEFGLFGGYAGDAVLGLVDALPMPLVITLHTILAEPDADQRRVMDRLIAKASKLMVMTDHSRYLLQDVYGVDDTHIVIVEHGVPDRPFGNSACYKQQLGFDGPTLLTFGLLSPGKGIEHAINALPDIVRDHPDVTYCIAGATHPNLVTREGEAYRHRLQSLARELKVDGHIRWIDKFLDLPDLLDLIDAADIYLTPYPGAGQSTSGTLAYAVALGKAVVSTPYVHAKDLLSGDIGVLVPFGDAPAISQAINALLDHPADMAAMQQRAYLRGREMTWANYAARCWQLAEEVRVPDRKVKPFDRGILPVTGLLAMCDTTGILQHSCGIVPNRQHGYCIDDNARALMLANRIGLELGPDWRKLTLSFAAFINHAWNAGQGVFRNFMDYSGNWLEEAGSEDSNGRTLWVLGASTAESADANIRHWAADLYKRAIRSAEIYESPRAIAFAMLGAAYYVRHDPDHTLSRGILTNGARLLRQLYATASKTDWHWFESVLAYDNARLPEALIRAGIALGDDAAIRDGLATLRWLNGQHITQDHLFRPVGSDSFGRHYEQPLPFDQQPLEAWAVIDACAAAHDADGDMAWVYAARIAYDWYAGGNDRAALVGDPATGRCLDGVTPLGLNLNSGAESLLAYHLAHHGLRCLLANCGPI